MSDNVMPVERIERSIYLIRGQKVMLDRDLAVLYGVETKRLKEQVRTRARPASATPEVLKTATR